MKRNLSVLKNRLNKSCDRYCIINAIFALFYVMGCQSTVPVRKQVSLPLSVAGFFDSCRYGDGVISLSVERGGEVIFQNVNLDWVASRGNGWRLEAYNPLGQTSISIKFNEQNVKFEKSGILADRIPDLSISKSGFLEVKGEFLPIRPEEVVCFLKNKIPQSWTNNIAGYEINGQSAKFSIWESERRIIVDISDVKKLNSERICVRFIWKKFWSLVENSAKLCENMEKPKSVQIKGIDDFDIKWIMVED
ncbi:MAG: hypothetical protein HQK54_03255 [Oligoflexales bacterium]|nr:hypothetical protein [Oligoflexales bacterium]